MQKITARMWLSFLLIGLAGQFAWTIENMYFNVYLYNTISTDPNHIAAMVAASAAVATVTTLLMGALSDRVGRRKPFIVGGYLVWGLSTMSFGFITVDAMATLFPMANAVALAAAAVILMDCVMTFFGSTANDAAFNAYITDVTTTENRGRAESVLSILPLISMLVIFGLFDGMTAAGKWREFFLIFGGLVIVVGLISAFLLKDAKNPVREAPYFDQLLYGFRPSTVKANRPLYLALVAFGLFSVAVQVFFPYLIIYLQNYLKFDNYAIVLGGVLIIASVVSVVFGRFIDRLGKLRCLLPALFVMAAGLLLMFFARSMAFVFAAGAIMMSGYMLVTAVLSASIRDYTPIGQAGSFQGIRMIFAVLLPMIIGPFIGAAVIRGGAGTYEELGTVKNIPTPAIFLASAVVLLTVLIPLVLMKKEEKKKC